MEKNNVIVSLGINCLVRTFLTRGNVKPSKENGELSCPFDLVYHTFDRVIEALDTNFQTYFDNLEYYIYQRKFFGLKNKGRWRKKDSSVEFFHDRDCGKDEFDKLKTRFENRIQNLNNLIEKEEMLFFVLAIYTPTDRINELYSILKRRRNNKKFKLIIINFADCVYNGYDDLYILNIPAPVEHYTGVWNNKKYRNKPLFKYVEKCVCKFVENIIRESEK